jgi:UDPglucose--hexose-1-phosphate uridylyltransferase
MQKRIFKRNDGKDLLLFGLKPHIENNTTELEISPIPKPHLRWNPSRQEWVTYSAGRSNRTAFPPKEYCPLCPGGNLNFPTEIPFSDFEVAVFPNRWSSFNTHNETVEIQNIITKPSNGQCEVVVYSSNHNDTIAEMPLERIKLLTNTWIDRYLNLLIRDDIKYVMPFENRGEECGVTLHHPHGQIYCYPHIPPVIEKEILAFKKENFILAMMNGLEEKYFVFQDDNMIAAVPPFARYAYEIWIMPKKKRAGPWQFDDNEIKSFAKSLQKVVKGYDSFLGKKCPYIMGLHAAPTLKDESFHFHVEFYPPLRSGDKPKILAGSESLAGVFIMDVLPEESAEILREHINQ